MSNQIPSIRHTAFSCPHCGAYTTQHWYQLYRKAFDGDSPKPLVPDEQMICSIKDDVRMHESAKAEMLTWAKKMKLGLPFFEHESNSHYLGSSVSNLWISECYNCHKLAVWVHDNLVHPRTKTAAAPNPDLPDDIKVVFEEARAILEDSPRGSAALLRLCIQKLCSHLGEKGKSIDADIASLVQKGLSPVVQQSLDIVRVIGNESVHPGEINLNDDRETAVSLFELVNSICDQMISHPAKVAGLYSKLPEAKRKAIEKRDASKK